MGGEGSILAMIMSIKDNARLKSNIHNKWGKDKNYRYEKHIPLEFKKLPKEELVKIIADNRQKAKQERKRGFILTITVFSAVVIIMLLVFGEGFQKFVVDRNRKKVEQAEEYKRKMVELQIQKDEEHLLFLLNKGYVLLDQKQYKKARTQFYYAHEFKPNDFRVKLANATVYVCQCVDVQKNCHIAERLLNALKTDFSDSTELLNTTGENRAKPISLQIQRHQFFHKYNFHNHQKLSLLLFYLMLLLQHGMFR